MTAANPGILMRTDVLVAVAKWASPDVSRPHLNLVTFRKNKCVATDGHRMVSVPCETYNYAFGVRARDLIAAAAAQRSQGSSNAPSLRSIALFPSLPDGELRIGQDDAGRPSQAVRLVVPFDDLAK